MPQANARPPGLAVVAVLFGGFFVTAAVSFALFFTFAKNGPFWLLPVMFFGPFLVFVAVLVFLGSRLLPRLKRAMPSPERVAAQAADEPDAWPTVPEGEGIAPGRELAYRLATTSRPGCFLLGALGVATFWNGIVSVFLLKMIESHLRGQPEWFLTFFLIPFVLIGLGMIVVVLVALVGFVTSLLAGSLCVEIAAHPLLPGATYDYLVEQVGLAQLRKVRLTLTCTESATYRQGTSDRTETKEVYRAEVGDPAPSLAGGLRGTLAVPAEAMHSFEAEHNKITWKLLVNGRVAGFLPHQCEYPVVVRPAGGTEP